MCIRGSGNFHNLTMYDVIHITNLKIKQITKPHSKFNFIVALIKFYTKSNRT